MGKSCFHYLDEVLIPLVLYLKMNKKLVAYKLPSKPITAAISNAFSIII